MKNFYTVYLQASTSQKSSVLASSSEDAGAIAISNLENFLFTDGCELVSVDNTLITLERVPSPQKTYTSLKDVYVASSQAQEGPSLKQPTGNYTPLVSS